MKRAAAGFGVAAAGAGGLASSAYAGSDARGGIPAVATIARPRIPFIRSGRSAFELGVATYSLREFSREEAITIINDLGVTNVSVKSFHLPYELSPAELEHAADEFREAGLQLVSSGNNTITEDTDEHVGAFFDYAKAAGIPMLVIAPDPQVLPRIESFVKRYDIKVAIHNHGPEDNWYPAPSDAIALINDMDPRVGVCVDVGHTARTGKDVVQEIGDAGSRVLDVHMKDLRDMSDAESQCAVGEGKMPVADIFRQLGEIGFSGSVSLEYEIHPNDPYPGMMQSLAYMRGVRDGLSG
jgi:sugar phosphate isomerase/epimerase